MLKRIGHLYGMRLRGFAPLCQPKEGLIRRMDDKTGKYHDMLVYERMLTDHEVEAYELDYIGPIYPADGENV